MCQNRGAWNKHAGAFRDQRVIPKGVRSEMIKRFICSLVVVCILTSISPIAVFAQSYPRPDDRDSYISEVTNRAALAEDLDKKRQEAQYRRKTIEESIRRLQNEQPPAGTDRSTWERQRQDRINWLNDYMRRNEQTLQRYEKNLGSVNSRLENDRKYIMTSDDPELKQSLGTLIGIAGAAGIPIASRPTMGTLKASVGRSMMGMRLNSTNRALTKAMTRQTALQTKASTFQAPTKGTWTPEVNAKGDLILRNGSKVKNMGRAEIKAADGTMIKNDAAYQKSNYYKQLYDTRSGLSHRINELKHQRQVSKNAKAQKAIDQRIKQLEAKKGQLESDIAKHDSENQSHKSVMKNLAVSAAKWAAFSAGMVVATDVFNQLKSNGWNVRAIDWAHAIQPLKTANFWGGTAGSFAGSMLLTAMVPGGAFARTLAGIAGAAIGWQVGTGNLFETDWMQLGATSVGATIGAVLGSFLGPIGTFLGGMAGHFVADWLLNKVRGWLTPGYSSYDPSKRQAYDYDPEKAAVGWNRPQDSYDRPDDGSMSSQFGDAKSLQQRMLELQREMTALMRGQQNPNTIMQLDSLRREYGQVQRQLSGMREQASSGHYGY